MILFSTVLRLNKNFTQDDFIKTVIEWNQNSPHPENVISGIAWNGERSARYGTDKLWLALEEYRNENIIAVRYEKVEANGTIWDSDYIMNFNTMKMAIQLDRSYTEDALIMDPAFSTPYFIRLLIEKGYLRADGDLQITEKPVLVTETEVPNLADVINGQAKHDLPIVYVSKNAEGTTMVNTWDMAYRLKGVAHVLAAENSQIDTLLSAACADQNEKNGSVGIYYPNTAAKNRTFPYHVYEDGGKMLADRMVRNVIDYCNAQLADPLYTWQGVNNALLLDRLKDRTLEFQTAELETRRMREENDELLDSVDKDLVRLRKQVEELTRTNEALKYENQGLRSKLNRTDAAPILYLGEETELFPDEIKAILLDALEAELPKYEEKTRRHTVIEDVIRENDCKKTAGEKAEKLKNLLKGYKSLSGSLKRELQNMGFEITDDGKHSKLTYYGDSRYMATLAKTPSDGRSGSNIAAEMIRTMF